MEIDRRAFIASLGGAAAVNLMDHEAKAEALEHYMEEKLDEMVAAQQPEKFPTVAEIEAQIETRNFRRGVGGLFAGGRGNMQKLPPMPAKPTLMDYFKLRFQPANHVLQSATRAMKTGMSEEVILACLLHDVVQSLIKVGSRLVGRAAVRALHPREEHVRHPLSPGAALLRRRRERLRISGSVPPHVRRSTTRRSRTSRRPTRWCKNHKWYIEPRLVTVNDLYAFDPNAEVTIEPFTDIVGRHFKQPKEGLGFDNSPSAHMWRTLARPDQPL